MADVVFILGAGASKECGAPLMENFLDEAFKVYASGRDRGKKEHFERVFRAIGRLQAVHSKAELDLKNIESIFTTFEMGRTIGKLPSFEPDEIPGVIESLREIIVCTLEETIKFPTRGPHAGPPGNYASFVKLLEHLSGNTHPAQSVAAITFNYDVALDVAFARGGLWPDYALPEGTTKRQLTPLLKLHGSLNWAVNEETREVHAIPFYDYFSHYSLQFGLPGETGTCSIPIGSQLVEYFSKHRSMKVRPSPLIVPPSWNKTDYHREVASVWNAAATHLGEAKEIYVLGYSLPATDQFFRLLYALGSVGPNPLSRFAVFNPDTSDAFRERFSSLLGPGARARFELHHEGFSSAVQKIKGFYPAKER